MSANTSNPVPDPALQRLNYFNGQRLAAADLRAEQAHHLGMRRVLNQSLYSPGIVAGLELSPDPAHKHKVIVQRGLAFDHLGREIFVPVDVAVLVAGAPSTTPGVVFGNLLVVSYREQRRQPAFDRCQIGLPYAPCSGDLPWGAPTRILAEAVFEVVDAWPAEASGRVVLGQIELNNKCEVVRVLPGVRQYAVPVKPQVAQALALEGEKDLDKDNPKVLVFHVRGGAPEQVTLYLRGRRFASLYYTELGRHGHIAHLTINDRSITLTHTHTASAATQTDPAGGHGHDLLIDVKEAEGDPRGVDMQDVSDCAWLPDPIKPVGDHFHTITQLQIDDWVKVDSHNHSGSAVVDNNGATDLSARTAVPALAHFNDLKIVLDSLDVTALVRQQLEAKPGQAGKWPTIGDGSAAHPFASADGTGEIDLLKLGLEIGLGQHRLEFSVDGAGNGGTLQYNLYLS
jgi:hypothetical protein